MWVSFLQLTGPRSMANAPHGLASQTQTPWIRHRHNCSDEIFSQCEKLDKDSSFCSCERVKTVRLKPIIGLALTVITFIWSSQTSRASLVGLWSSDPNNISGGAANTNTDYETIEFLKDGSFKITDCYKAINGNQQAIPIMSGKYTLIVTNHVRLELKNGLLPLNVPFSISGDQLEILALIPSSVMETKKYRRVSQ
jgi:hypothetical protein